MLEVRDLTVRYGDLVLVDKVSFTLNAGEMLMIVGPNGAGKSTLVSAITQGVPFTGEVFFEGVNVRQFKPVQLARSIGMLMQTHYVGYAFKVAEVVRLGRYAHRTGILGGLGSSSDTDENAIVAALESTGLTQIADQSVLTLSGGELQRTFLAQVFAQDPRLLILDEPTNHLDLVYQKRVFELLTGWLADTNRQRAVLAVVHDLNLALAFASRVLLMDQGGLVAIGRPDEALAPERLDQVYQMDVRAWMRGLLAGWK
ncbi:MAG: ABC transporter ATP-binding protein [Coriobacteriales bacterium]|jgi:iron complex transport system ATP-binding protein|nr:ABC transporter ATP-binding protein [Coriobacteriales bacterium]